MNQFLLAFVTGVTTGGLSCFAIQGGLLASALTSSNGKNKLVVTNVFFAAKLFAIIVLGALLGLVGEKILITPKFQGYMQILAGVVMLLTAARLAHLHPIFNKFQISPPKWAFRISRQLSKDESVFSALLLGLSTVLIPCGITQSMMILAIGSGSPFAGAMIMGVYTIGTAPVFYALGLATGKFMKHKAFAISAAIVIAYLGLTAINTGQVLRGSVHTFQNYYKAVLNPASLEGSGKVAGTKNGVQDVTINVITGGYKSSAQTLKSGVPVELKLITKNTQGCSRAFTIPSINYSKVLPATGTETVEFTPTEKGRLVYTCSMGMYTGYFDVI